ncbi:MAG TPA: DUF429 domain-containing protein [Anaerolineales bacterium]|nr:DUF429 domain-containing protein [Anaerolineales bacterium]
MFFTEVTYIGIDPTAGQRPFSFAALDGNLRLVALAQGDLDEVLAFVAGQRQALVAVASPRQPNQGLMERAEVRDNLSPSPRPGRWTNFRLCEYQLRQHNITIPQTASQAQDCPRWMQMGFTLYKRLETISYHLYPQEDHTHQYLEVYPHACYTVLLNTTPFSKHSLEGRLQRQLLLYEKNLNLPDPMRFFEEVTRHRLLHGILADDQIYSPYELDALVAAYTAWAAGTQPDQVLALGDPGEGQVVLPVPSLKPRY